jgi:uncharacterized membrane protein
MHLIDILTIVLAGLMVGNELTVSLFINPVMQKLDAAARTRALSLFAGLLGRVMPFWYALCLILFAIETFAHRGGAAYVPLLAASLLWAAIIVATIFLLVPINNRVAALTVDAPLEHWLPEQRRWERMHRIRIVLLVVALALATYALLAA